MAKRSFPPPPDKNDTDPEANRIAPDLAARLQEAVQQAGGQTKVAERAGIAPRSLSRYLVGYDIKRRSLIALADACGVTIEWLAAGRGPMRPGEAPPQKSNEPMTYKLFGTIDMERLGVALETTVAAFHARGSQPSWRRIAQVVTLIYDVLSEPDPEPQRIARTLSETLAEPEKSC